MKINQVAGLGDVWLNEHYRGSFRRERYIDATTDMTMCKAATERNRLERELSKPRPLILRLTD